jgi:hypothetical protein
MHAVKDFFSIAGIKTLIYFYSDDRQQAIPSPLDSLQIIIAALSKQKIFLPTFHES